MSDQSEKKEFVPAAMLGTLYGLTRKMVDDLGEPDMVRPHGGQFARLYRVERVEAWVAANLEWIDRANAAQAQQAARKKAAAAALRLAMGADEKKEYPDIVAAEAARCASEMEPAAA